MDREHFDHLEQTVLGAIITLESRSFRFLLYYPHHIYMNTYDHSVRAVVCMAWFTMRNNADPNSAVRVGLLHGPCLVDYIWKNDHSGFYYFYHPERTTTSIMWEFGLTRKETRAIRAYMFPLSIHLPSSKLVFRLLFADKAVMLYEVLLGVHFPRNRVSHFTARRITRTRWVMEIEYLLPRFRELSQLGLYLDQVVTLVNEMLSPLPPANNHNKKEVQPFMVSVLDNYVKLHILIATVKK